MLALALMVFVLRQASDDARWSGMEKFVKVGFWGTNVGLAMMVALSLFPSGVLQVWDVVQNGYWHARSLGSRQQPFPHDRVDASSRRSGIHPRWRSAARDRCYQRLDWPPSTGKQLISTQSVWLF